MAGRNSVPLLSDLARRKKANFFFRDLPADARILEVGCGSGWVREQLREAGLTNYVGLDLVPPADVVGDVREWRSLGMKPESFDAIVAFEVVEHVDCFQACHDLLKPGGRLLITTPVPHRDWVMKCLERVGLNQKRTSPHDHLVYLEKVPLFGEKRVKVVAGLSQWGVFVK
jgi:2-polyprenyl-3-methyl-5-hydroxy-6-metoxy-1,4-benzoquinol methylase